MTEREKSLILAALRMLGDHCIGGDLHHETADGLGGTPDPEEVRALMDKIKAE